MSVGLRIRCIPCRKTRPHKKGGILGMTLVAVTDQCPHQVIRPHTDQSAGRAHWFHLPLKNYFFKPFLEVDLKNREHTASREERPLSTGHSSINDLHWRSLLLHSKELTLRPATLLRLDTQKNFSPSDTSLLSVMKINHSLLSFKEVLLFCSVLHKQLQINL